MLSVLLFIGGFGCGFVADAIVWRRLATLVAGLHAKVDRVLDMVRESPPADRVPDIQSKPEPAEVVPHRGIRFDDSRRAEFRQFKLPPKEIPEFHPKER